MKKIGYKVGIFIFLVACFLLFSKKTDAASTSVTYQTKVQNSGWTQKVTDGAISGTTGKTLRLEAIKIEASGINTSVQYRVHVQSLGWSLWEKDGALAGTANQPLQLEAIQIQLSNSTAYSIEYRVHVQGIGWMDWKRNGEIAGTTGRGLQLEAIQIRLVKNPVSVQYNAHVEGIGWMPYVSNGSTAGTTGKGLRLEGMKINITGLPSNSSIQYRAHVEGFGWMAWNKENQLVGTTGQSRRMEAIEIKLQNAEEYSIRYRVHIESIGWTSWEKDGAMAGTTGKSLRLEAIEIQLVPKQGGNKIGIDVSKHQGTINWSQVKNSGIDFVMIRAGFRGYGQEGTLNVDEQFYRNIQGATSVGLKVGVYFFTQAINETEAKAEANFTLNLIRNYPITYPVAIDVEESSSPTHTGRADSLTKLQRTANVKAFCETIEQAGYKPMVYANKWWLMEQLNMSSLAKYDVWLAHYTGATQNDPFEKPSDYQGSYKMWQYTDKGRINGITGNVDFNVSFYEI